jgi:hypothetical protein
MYMCMSQRYNRNHVLCPTIVTQCVLYIYSKLFVSIVAVRMPSSTVPSVPSSGMWEDEP